MVNSVFKDYTKVDSDKYKSKNKMFLHSLALSTKLIYY